MLSSNDLLLLYVSIELQSLSLYVLVALNRDSLKSSEAALKCFILGSIASAIILYGISLHTQLQVVQTIMKFQILILIKIIFFIIFFWLNFNFIGISL